MLGRLFQVVFKSSALPFLVGICANVLGLEGITAAQMSTGDELYIFTMTARLIASAEVAI
jgi:hypothetical protein